MLKHTKGNLIDLAEQGEFDVIVHGCNCQNTMGSGIAKEIKERYPLAYRADSNMHSRTQFPVQLLGNYSLHVGFLGRKSGSSFAIVNAYTQLDYNKKDEEFLDRFEYGSFSLILKKMATEFPARRFGFPYIGMGLAGGDSTRIIAMLENFATRVTEAGSTVTLVEFG